MVVWLLGHSIYWFLGDMELEQNRPGSCIYLYVHWLVQVTDFTDAHKSQMRSPQLRFLGGLSNWAIELGPQSKGKITTFMIQTWSECIRTRPLQVLMSAQWIACSDAIGGHESQLT